MIEILSAFGLSAATGNPIISVAEDVISGVSAFMAIVLPVLVAIFIVAILGLFIRWKVRKAGSRPADA